MALSLFNQSICSLFKASMASFCLAFVIDYAGKRRLYVAGEDGWVKFRSSQIKSTIPFAVFFQSFIKNVEHAVNINNAKFERIYSVKRSSNHTLQDRALSCNVTLKSSFLYSTETEGCSDRLLPRCTSGDPTSKLLRLRTMFFARVDPCKSFFPV